MIDAMVNEMDWTTWVVGLFGLLIIAVMVPLAAALIKFTFVEERGRRMNEPPVLPTRNQPRARSIRTAYLVPGTLFIALAVALWWGLSRDPSKIPSVLIGKPVPEFSLPPVHGRTLGLASTDLQGEVSLVNVFASWCTACRVEHPVFMRLQQDGTVPIHGINYKDRPEDAANWLDELGDPYTRTGADIDGRVSIDWGVYGVPETFVIGRDGRIAYKHIGAVTPQILNDTLLPLIRRLRQ